MAIVKYNEESFECSVALKGADYIHLLDANGVLVAAFDRITNFSAFTIESGTWTTPTDPHDCYVATVGEDGVVRRGGHKCSDLISKADLEPITIFTSEQGELYIAQQNENDEYTGGQIDLDADTFELLKRAKRIFVYTKDPDDSKEIHVFECAPARTFDNGVAVKQYFYGTSCYDMYLRSFSMHVIHLEVMLNYVKTTGAWPILSVAGFETTVSEGESVGGWPIEQQVLRIEVGLI